jgi:FKBP-type peptidyl-prolyl cis-trans isomerase 2
MTVKEGSKVKVDYTGSFEDGTVFDSSEKHGQPLEFTIGAKQVVPGFEAAIVGMAKDEEKEITLQPKDAYGDVNPEMMRAVPKEQLPKDQEVKPGMMLAIGLPDGKQIPAKIAAVNDKEVTIDLNHPLAGKVLKFKVKVVDFE